MSTRMLIDARHPEETRVTVVKGSRVEEFDYESAARRPLKGNIYLARVTRVEPSLQAAFVEYGGNRHGFLAFSEIHPDYYQIPVEDRQELIEAETKAALERAQELDAKLEQEAEEAEKKKKPRRGRRRRKKDNEAEVAEEANAEVDAKTDADTENATEAEAESKEEVEETTSEDGSDKAVADASAETAENSDDEKATDDDETSGDDEDGDADTDGKDSDEADKDAEIAEAAARRQALRALKRRYSIQEVIKRRQVLLVQVVKEERGNKGAALTTYMSLAGRYCVLMPNSTHSGGISRKISNASDRRNLKKIISALDVPDEMGLIVRTAGMERTKTEIKRDYDYLLRLWNGIRDLTLQSVAPSLIYEEGNLIKRTIRDLYTRDIDEIQVEGETGYRAAKDFMKLLMPSHAKKVQHYQDPIPLFHRYQVESHLEAMYQPIVQLKSGGYIVINPTEALISIDVNSGRATKEHNIEETAVKTNLEAAEEVARQLRLRDMAGLVVIDFIDMEERSNNRAVERRMKEVLKSDRARIQVGRISSFGLMEMSRQRLRSNLLEVSMETCPHCSGTGIVRSTESAALMALRMLEEEGIRGRSSVVRVSVCPDVAVYLLNKKRKVLSDLESQYNLEIEVLAQPSMRPSEIDISREAQADGNSGSTTVQAVKPDTSAEEMPTTPSSDEDGERQPRKRRRRRRRRRGGGDQQNETTAANENETGEVKVADGQSDDQKTEAGDDEERKPRRRRGSRGGRRRNERSKQSDEQTADGQETAEVAETPEEKPADGDAEKPRRRRRVKKSEASDVETPKETEDAATSDSGDAAEEKPKRRTRRRKTETAAENATAESAEVKSDDSVEEKPKRTRRRTKKAEDTATDAPTEEKKPRTRRKKAEPKAETESSATADAEKTEKKPTRRRTRKAPEAKQKTASEAKVEKAPAPAPAPSPAETSESGGGSGDKPKRKGWWQRTFG